VGPRGQGEVRERWGVTEAPQGGPAVDSVGNWGTAAAEALEKIKQADGGNPE
jgi:hypothetical protein